jgi:hypothetical protein
MSSLLLVKARLFEYGRRGFGVKFVAGFAGNGHRSRLFVMLELAVTSALSHLLPTVVL